MHIEPIHCPACFAAATIPPAVDRVTCEYCGTTSFIEQSQGQVTLKFAHELAGLRQTFQDSGAQTAESVRASAADTQKELQRLRLSQELSAVEVAVANTQAELRAVQRSANKKNSRTVKTQSAALEKKTAELNARGRQLQASLNALDPATPVAAGLAATKKSPTGRSRAGGCLLWGTAWFGLFILLSGMLMQALGEVGIMLALIFSIVIVVYFQHRRARKAAE